MGTLGSNPSLTAICGYSSGVEHLLAKQRVVSSNLITRSKNISTVWKSVLNVDLNYQKEIFVQFVK
jgi:hypothetical protein